MQVPTSLGCPAPFMGVVAPSSDTASSLNEDGWIGVLHTIDHKHALDECSSESLRALWQPTRQANSEAVPKQPALCHLQKDLRRQWHTRWARARRRWCGCRGWASASAPGPW